MPTQKSYVDAEIGQFTVTKKSNARRITLRIGRNGIPNVSVPTYTPYRLGVRFLQTHRDWVKRHSTDRLMLIPEQDYTLYDGTLLQLRTTTKRNATQKTSGKIRIAINPNKSGWEDYAYKTLHKRLATDTEGAVLPRIDHFQQLLGVAPELVRFRSTTSRWGSCSARGTVTFSSFMAQLPNDLIDYVVIHELAHLRQMNHSQAFWALVAGVDPKWKQHRKQLRAYPLQLQLKKVMV